MKISKITLILLLIFGVGNIGTANAQSWADRLGKRAENAAKREVERKIDEKASKAVDDAFDKAEQNNKQKKGKKTSSMVEPPDTGTPAANTSDWDNKEPYYNLKKGAQIEYTLYNGKGKIQGYNRQKVVDMTRSKNGVNAVVSSTQTDTKGKVENATTVSLRYSRGNYYVNLLDMAPLKGLENVDIKANMSGNDMMIPGKLTPGQLLPDAKATFKMTMKSGQNTMEVPPVEFRVFNRRAVRAESVDTPLGKFVCYKIIQTVEADYPIIGTQVFTTITWIGKGLGMVKTEAYDKKGKLQSRMLLTGFE